MGRAAFWDDLIVTNVNATYGIGWVNGEIRNTSILVAGGTLATFTGSLNTPRDLAIIAGMPVNSDIRNVYYLVNDELRYVTAGQFGGNGNPTLHPGNNQGGASVESIRVVDLPAPWNEPYGVALERIETVTAND